MAATAGLQFFGSLQEISRAPNDFDAPRDRIMIKIPLIWTPRSAVNFCNQGANLKTDLKKPTELLMESKEKFSNSKDKKCKKKAVLH